MGSRDVRREIRKPSGLLFERKGGEAAEDQAEDEEGEPETNRMKQLSLVSCFMRGELIEWRLDFRKKNSSGIVSEVGLLLQQGTTLRRRSIPSRNDAVWPDTRWKAPRERWRSARDCGKAG